MISGGKCN
uniref:Uncharacterized protein n=1 Tax=Anguilla anguilla TaxID=7936 RepID=A0A0E9PT07_ANGAN